MLNQTPSTNYGSSQRISLNGDKDSAQSRFAVKCIIFTGVAVLGFILMLLFSSSSNASDDTVSHIRAFATKSSHQGKHSEELTYRVNFHVCDTRGAGEDLDRAYSPEYFLQITTAQGVSDALQISNGLSKDGYIGQQYKLSGLGRDIQSVTFIANNNEPICIDSITASVDPFDARGSIEKAWITQSHEFLVSNVCNGDDTKNSELYDRFLYFVGVSIDNIYNDEDSSSAKLSVQLTGRNGKKSEVFQLNEEGGKLMKDEYYVRLYESDINLGNKIDSVDIFFPDDEDIDGVHINQILTGSASNPGAVTMTADTDWWFKSDCNGEEQCGKVKSFDAVCYGADTVDDDVDEIDEEEENNFIDSPKKPRKGKGANRLKKNKRSNK